VTCNLSSINSPHLSRISTATLPTNIHRRQSQPPSQTAKLPFYPPPQTQLNLQLRQPHFFVLSKKNHRPEIFEPPFA
jgi:hypothetical protein